MLVGEAVPAWLPTCLKHCLVRERHHKVLRRLLHLLAAVPSNPPCSETSSQPIRNDTDRSRQHQEATAEQRTSGKAHNTICNASHAVAPESATQPSHATAELPSLSTASVAPSTSSSICDLQSPEAATAALQTAATKAALQHCEQLRSMVTQACQPSVKREGLRCLGAAVHSVVAALMPSKAQQQDTQHHCHQQQPFSPSAVACVTGVDQGADSQHLSQAQRVQELEQTATDVAQRDDSSKGSDEAQLGSSVLHEIQVRNSYSDSDSNTARLRDSATSKCPPQLLGRAQFEHRASDAQPAQRGHEQTAHDLVDSFVALVSMHSEAQQFDDMRLAAATALAASGSHSTSFNTGMSPCWCGSEAGGVILDSMSVACMSELSAAHLPTQLTVHVNS